MSDTAARAAAARRLLDDPVLVEALASVRTEAIAKWERTGPDQVTEREFAWLTVKALDRITGALESVITDGAIAAKRVQAPVR